MNPSEPPRPPSENTPLDVPPAAPAPVDLGDLPPIGTTGATPHPAAAPMGLPMPMLIAGGVAVGLLLGAVVGVASLVFGGGGLSADLRYAPDETELLVCLDAESLRASSAYKEITAQAGSSSTNKFDEDMEKETGLRTEDVERVVVAGNFNSTMGGSPVFIIRAKKPVDTEKLKTNFAKGKATEETVEAVKLCLAPMSPYAKSQMAVCSPESKLLVFGDAGTLKAILNRGGRAKLQPSVESAIKQIDTGKTVSVVVCLEGAVARKTTEEFGMSPFFPPEFKLLSDCQLIALHWEARRDGNRVTASVECKNDKTATDIQDLLKGGIVKLKSGKDTPKDVVEALETATVTAAGKRVDATIDVKSTAIGKGGLTDVLPLPRFCFCETARSA